MLQARFRTVFSSTLSKQAALCAALIGLGIGAFYIARVAEIAILFGAIVGHSNVVEESVKNERGDKVTVSTDVSGSWQYPERTVIRLRLGHYWFSNALLKTESYGFRWRANWRNDDSLDLDIGFGCVVHATSPITAVGPIRIFYHFTYNDTALDLDLARSDRIDGSACQAVHHARGPSR